MPTLSIFTPSHNTRFLNEAWASLQAQSHKEFEWVVVLNGGARWEPPDDPRVKVTVCDELRGVGAAKRHACALATGDVLVELDHDDLLTVDALATIHEVFDQCPDVGFTYSDTAQIQEDGTMDPSTWDQRNGWVYDTRTVRVGKPSKRTPLGFVTLGRKVLAVEAMAPTPHNLSFIWFAPNHVRAFRTEVYHQAGGYDADRDILDDQDIMCRMFNLTRFSHIGRCLYLQRIHGDMTQKQQTLNDRIQTETLGLHDRYVESLALAWAKREELTCLDLGGALNPAPGYQTVDRREPADFVGEVFDVLDGLPESSVGVVRAVDFLEHVADKVGLFNRIHRVLAPDGLLLACTPSTDGRGAWQDPTHVAGYNENSFWYFTDRSFQQYVPEITARFQVSRVVTYYPSDFHRTNLIPYVQANLVALKEGGSRNGGHLTW